MKRVFILSCCIVLFCAVAVRSACAYTLTSADPPDHPRSKAMFEVLTECFRRLGSTVFIETCPSKRSLHEADCGKADGNFLRTKGITEAYPNLIMVPEPISKNVIVAYSRRSDIVVAGWKSLLPYHVAWVRGWRNCERELADAHHVSVLNNEVMLFEFLDDSRADVGVFGLDTGTKALEQLGITEVKPLYPPVVISDLYLYLHRDHKAIVPVVAETLREMKRDGSYGAILEKYGQ